VAGAIPATNTATLRSLALRYSDSRDLTIAALPPSYARQIRRRLILLLACDVAYVAA
jgi:hypothetical protein